MPVVVTKEIKKKRILLAVFGALVLVSALVLYFGFWGGGEPPVLPPAGSIASGGSQAISDLDVGVLEDERFKNLKAPPGVPVATSTTGKKNPFSD